MLPVRPSAAIAVLLALVLAGCSGKGSDQNSGSEPAGAAPAIPGADTGSIRGIVTDDSLLPLQGAHVGVLEQQLEALTDAQGKFTFNGVQPGAVRVAATKLGYETAAKNVQVEAGKISDVGFILKPVALLDVPHSVLNITEGRIICGQGNPIFTDVICGDPLFLVASNPDQKFLFKYTIEKEATGQLWEQAWKPTQILSRNLAFFLEKDDCGTSCPSGSRFASPAGCCYLRVALDDKGMDIGTVKAGTSGATIQSRTFPKGANGDVTHPEENFFLDQRFTIYWEQFWGPLPDDFETTRTNVPVS